jgi:hypothetical protein
MLLKAGLRYYTLGLLVLNTQNIVFPEFKNKKPLKAIEEDPKPNLLIKKVYKINDKGNKIRDNLITLTKQRKRPREDNISFPKSQTLKKQALKSTRHTNTLK